MPPSPRPAHLQGALLGTSRTPSVLPRTRGALNTGSSKAEQPAGATLPCHPVPTPPRDKRVPCRWRIPPRGRRAAPRTDSPAAPAAPPRRASRGASARYLWARRSWRAALRRRAGLGWAAPGALMPVRPSVRSAACRAPPGPLLLPRFPSADISARRGGRLRGTEGARKGARPPRRQQTSPALAATAERMAQLGPHPSLSTTLLGKLRHGQSGGHLTVVPSLPRPRSGLI